MLLFSSQRNICSVVNTLVVLLYLCTFSFKTLGYSQMYLNTIPLGVLVSPHTTLYNNTKLTKLLLDLEITL